MQNRSNAMWWGAAIEAPDPHVLATFYSTLLDWPVVHTESDVAIIAPPQESVYIVFQFASDYVAPEWPSSEGQQRTMMHLDFQVGNLDAAVDEAISLGARLSPFQPQDNVRVLFDPAGHPFCLCVTDD